MRYVLGTAMVCATVILAAGGVSAQTGQPAGRGRPTPSAAPAPAAPQSQATVFKCPAAGTVIETKTAAQITEYTSLGADPADATLCKTKRGFSTNEFYFGRFSNNISADGLTALRQGLRDLFAGTRAQFTARYETAAVGGNRFQYEDTWRRVGTETVTIAGKPVSAIAFERAQQNLGANFQGTEKLWYDPASGAWIKRMKVSGGENSNNFAIDWEVSKITGPGS